MGRARWFRLAGVWLAVGLVPAAASACGSGAGPPLFPGPGIVTVTMVDNQFQYDPRIPSGRVVFQVSNAGQEAHRLTMVPLPADVPPINQQLHGPVRVSIVPFAATPTMPPGSRDSFAVDLAPGQRYALLDFLQSPTASESHAMMGMNSEFRTPGQSIARS
ncbi:MAG: hypothetical protein M3083_10335 [Actinomycetota bacterium]|nr:hypothetical protein [Actinomycetota bacterium]